MILASKALATDVAGERSFVGVRAFVYHQVVGLGELALTRAAHELLTMSGHITTNNQLSGTRRTLCANSVKIL